MTLAAEDINPIVAERAWSRRAAELESTQGHWSDYAAWEEWLKEREVFHASPALPDGIAGFDPIPIFDSLDYEQKIMLYVIMCGLAD